MKIGFSGTRQETTVEQHRSLIKWLQDHPAEEFHHGCCIGADTEAAEIASSHVNPKPVVIGHPPINRAAVSHLAIDCCDKLRDQLDYLSRNRAIVDETDVLLACPKDDSEVHRSGTWATIRYAWKTKKPVAIIWPDGSVDDLS